MAQTPARLSAARNMAVSGNNGLTLRERLIHQNLEANESLDGVFARNRDRTIAVTSDRLIFVSGSANAWALSWISWRAITGVCIISGASGRSSRVQVTYSQPPRVRGGENVTVDIEVLLDSEAEATRVVDLARARLEATHGSTARSKP